MGEFLQNYGFFILVIIMMFACHMGHGGHRGHGGRGRGQDEKPDGGHRH